MHSLTARKLGSQRILKSWNAATLFPQFFNLFNLNIIMLHYGSFLWYCRSIYVFQMLIHINMFLFVATHCFLLMNCLSSGKPVCFDDYGDIHVLLWYWRLLRELEELYDEIMTFQGSKVLIFLKMNPKILFLHDVMWDPTLLIWSFSVPFIL